MLVIWRRNGEWIEARHRSGDVIRIRVYAIKPGVMGAHCNLAILDDAKNFQITQGEHVRADTTQTEEPS